MKLNELNNQQKELCAVTVMRSMLEDYSIERGISFDTALFQFASSPAYKMLFDYSTGMWKVKIIFGAFLMKSNQELPTNDNIFPALSKDRAGGFQITRAARRGRV